MNDQIRLRDKFTGWVILCLVLLVLLPPVGVILVGITFPLLVAVGIPYGAYTAIRHHK